MDTKKIKQIIELFEDSTVASMDLEIDDIKIKLEKPGLAMPSPIAQMPTPIVAPVQPTLQNEVAMNANNDAINETAKEYIKSPLVGTYYASSSQGAKPFIEVGSKVKQGDVVCIIEAMKVMNEIKADKSGTILDIQVNDGDMVQFDQTLIAIGE